MYAHNRVRRLIIGQKLTLNQLDKSYDVSGRNLIPISLELSKLNQTTVSASTLKTIQQYYYDLLIN